MNNSTYYPKIKKIAATYGYDEQSRQCIEEMAELTKAINKYWRKDLQCGKYPYNPWDGYMPDDSKEYDNLLEEIAHSGMLKIWSSKSFSKKESEAARRKFEHAEKLDKNGKKEEAKKTRKSIKTIPSFEIFMSWMFAIRNAMADDVNKKLWNISPRIAMTRILGNARVAEFLEHHLSEKMISRIKKN